MSASYSIDVASQTIFWELAGALTDEELLDAARRLWGDPEYRQAYSRLIDATKANATRVSGEAIRSIADTHRRKGVGKIAYVVGGDAMYGMSRMYEAYADGVTCRIFRARSEALRWLSGEQQSQDAIT